jgi:hypothetical protein
VYQQYRDIVAGLESIQSRQQKVAHARDQLIGSFDTKLGNFRLPMRLRKRSGGLLAWRNIALCSQSQRDADLVQYQDDLARLPQTIVILLVGFEKSRIIVNDNLSLLQPETRLLKQALKKIDLSTSLLESKCV